MESEYNSWQYEIVIKMISSVKFLPCIVGWVNFDEKIIMNKSTPGIYSFYALVKVAKTDETNFEVTIGLRS
jgi:hypothetical protein